MAEVNLIGKNFPQKHLLAWALSKDFQFLLFDHVHFDFFSVFHCSAFPREKVSFGF